MAKTDPTGQTYPADAYVFGEYGRRLTTVKRAWDTAVLKAHGHTPVWTKTGAKLTPESRTILKTIDLHFHDLRHEGGSRLLECGWPLHHVPRDARPRVDRTDEHVPERRARRPAREHEKERRGENSWHNVAQNSRSSGHRGAVHRAERDA
jgi:hypothetical protein